ncbi:MAG: carbon storage regulator CsrA [Planctomycetaceae bacterium]|jgi:carbon storage regulator|nr:carbon storage regulator CsrA [Planctomycetaceae bacterium]MDG2387921.1 carbon storage regulator CsrA [Planctomycetaceae bacterium]
MLVLSRKKNERIVIGENIVITVVEVRGDRVRLGIEAPQEVPIHRSEVHEAIIKEQTEVTEQVPQASAEATSGDD